VPLCKNRRRRTTAADAQFPPVFEPGALDLDDSCPPIRAEVSPARDIA